jgi:hypothetical protein
VIRVTTEAGFPLRVVLGGSWTIRRAADAGSVGRVPARVGLGTLFSTGIPAGQLGRGGGATVAVAADLRADPGAWLLRVLLAVNADRVAAVVPADHEHVRDEAGQQAVAALVAGKYALRFLRGQPDAGTTIVVATAVTGEGAGRAGGVARWMLSRAHGKVGNTWRDGLLAAAQQEGRSGALTKREARALVEARSRRPDVLSARLIDLPRHQLAALLEDVDSIAPPT